jgi:hypothetical protein
MPCPIDPWSRGSRFPWFEFELVEDPSMPDDELEIRTRLDRLRVTNIGTGAESIDQAPEVNFDRRCGSCGQSMPTTEYAASIWGPRGELLPDPWMREGRVWHLPFPALVPYRFEASHFPFPIVSLP